MVALSFLLECSIHFIGICIYMCSLVCRSFSKYIQNGGDTHQIEMIVLKLFQSNLQLLNKGYLASVYLVGLILDLSD